MCNSRTSLLELYERLIVAEDALHRANPQINPAVIAGREMVGVLVESALNKIATLLSVQNISLHPRVLLTMKEEVCIIEESVNKVN